MCVAETLLGLRWSHNLPWEMVAFSLSGSIMTGVPMHKAIASANVQSTGSNLEHRLTLEHRVGDVSACTHIIMF